MLLYLKCILQYADFFHTKLSYKSISTIVKVQMHVPVLIISVL